MTKGPAHGGAGVRCWCISKGMAGMRSQMSGLARAVGVAYEMRAARLALPWAALPLAWVPPSLSVLRGLGPMAADGVPRLVISCGRHGVIPSIALKRRLGDAVLTVHIQDPHVDPARFDLVVVPRHDETRGENVHLTMGALHHVTAEGLAEARCSPEAARLKVGERPLVAVLIGGRNRYYDLGEREVAPLVEGLHRVVSRHGARLAVLGSNRTSPAVMAALAAAFGDEHLVWDGTGPNPYLAALALASHVVATGDSVSMISEAAATGRPVFVHHLPERRPAPRFRRFHAGFEAAGITRRFAGRLDEWRYEPPDDTARIAALIRGRLGLT